MANDRYQENKAFLSEQIITYIGNKRSLLTFIDNAVHIVLSELKKDKIDTFDVFSGSGIVSRFFKQYSNSLYVNDLEDYCKTINKCYLMNYSEFSQEKLNVWFNWLNSKLGNKQLRNDGFIYKLYAPQNDNTIKEGERVFFTTRNAKFIDTARWYLNKIPEPYKTLLLGPLIFEASTKNNTSGVFKGFYKNSNTNIGQFGGNGKNALQRILADIEIKKPVISNYECDVFIYQGNSNDICKNIPHVDLAYVDPPYNQHPYSSNYFMLNLINNYREPKDISIVSGIPSDWNKSMYNKKKSSLEALYDLCSNLNAEYILISYNSDGFIKYDDMINMLNEFGNVRVFDRNYNVFRACRNLHERDIHVTEYLFLLHKGGNKC